MAMNARLQSLLDHFDVRYEVIPHPDAYTAKDVALSAHQPSRRLAKVVVMRDEAGADFMVVLPAAIHVNYDVLHRVTGRSVMRLEDEAELQRLFPDCEVGTMPPFGKLYGLGMYVDPCLVEEEDICFQAGNHHELVSMRYRDFDRIARPFSMTACVHTQMVGAVR